MVWERLCEVTMAYTMTGSLPTAAASPNYGEQLAQQQSALNATLASIEQNKAANPSQFPNQVDKPWWSWMGSAGTFLFGNDNYQSMLDQGMNAWGQSRFGSLWNNYDDNMKANLWMTGLNDMRNSPNRYSGGLFGNGGLGTFKDISTMGLAVAGMLNQKKMRDRQLRLGEEAFNLTKQEYMDKEARAKEEFAARRNARSGGQI